jgi:hypothetical protein
MFSPDRSGFLKNPFPFLPNGHILKEQTHHAPTQSTLMRPFLIVKRREEFFFLVAYHLCPRLGESVICPDSFQSRDYPEAMSFILKPLDV